MARVCPTDTTTTASQATVKLVDTSTTVAATTVAATTAAATTTAASTTLAPATTTTTTAAPSSFFVATEEHALIDKDSIVPLILGVSAGIVFAAIVIGVAVWCVLKKKRDASSLRSNSSTDSHTALRRMAPDPPSGHSNYSSSGLDTRNDGSTGMSAGPIAAAVAQHNTMSSDGTEIGRVTNNGEYGRVDDNIIRPESDYERAPDDLFDSRSPLTSPQQQKQQFDDDSFMALAYGKQ